MKLFKKKPQTGPKIPLKDKIIVLGFWALLVLGVRIILYEIEPYKWLGSIGAITISMAIVLLGFRYIKPMVRYKEKFATVIRYWYTRRAIWFLYIITAVYVAQAVFIEYGHAHYGDVVRDQLEQIKSSTTREEEIIDRREVNEYIDSLPTLFEKLAYIFALVDINMNETARWSVWMVLTEEIEFIAFFILIKTGRLFKPANDASITK